MAWIEALCQFSPSLLSGLTGIKLGPGGGGPGGRARGHRRGGRVRPLSTREPMGPLPRARDEELSGPHRGQALSPFPGPHRPFQGPRQGPRQCFHGPAGPSRPLGPSGAARPCFSFSGPGRQEVSRVPSSIWAMLLLLLSYHEPSGKPAGPNSHTRTASLNPLSGTGPFKGPMAKSLYLNVVLASFS